MPSPLASRIRIGILVAALVGAALAGTTSAVPAPAPVDGGTRARSSGFTVARDVQYYFGSGSDRARHAMDLYLPTEITDYPVVLFVHGGTWRGGDKNQVPGQWYENVGRALAAQGIGVALVNHRLTDGSAGSVTHPGHVEDVARAFSFLRAYLITGGIDPNNLYLSGHESGAHLVALLATNGRFLSAHGLTPENVRGVMGLSGIYRIAPDGAEHADVFGTDPAQRRDASPVDHVSLSAPPFLLLYAAQDRPGLDEESRSMGRELAAAGATVGVHVIADRSHETIASSIGQVGDEATERMIGFVFGRRYTTPTPTATSTPTATPTPTPTPTPTATSASVGPPAQPPDGPGGALRPHGDVRVTEWGQGPDGYWRFEPTDPVPGQAPLVVFLHGAGPTEPEPYRRWLEHIARGGAVVVYPAYRLAEVDAESDDTTLWAERAAEAVRESLNGVPDGTSVAAAPDELVYVGHGEGAVVALDLAADWFRRRLPAPRVLMLLTPRRARRLLGPDADLGRVPNDTRTLLVAAEDDAGYDNATEVAVWDGLRHVPGAWRERVLLRTDRYGMPVLVADSAAPRTDAPTGVLDALDWYGTWKWLDGLMACTFAGLTCEYAFGGTSEQLGMGHWDDGRPVDQALASDDVPRPPTRRIYVPIAVSR